MLGSLGEMLDAGLGAGKEHIDALGDSLQAARAAGDALATGLEFASEFASEFELDLDFYMSIRPDLMRIYTVYGAGQVMQLVEPE